MPAAAAVARLDKPSSPGRQGTAAAGSPSTWRDRRRAAADHGAVPPADESKKVTWMIHGPSAVASRGSVVFNSVFEASPTRRARSTRYAPLTSSARFYPLHALPLICYLSLSRVLSSQVCEAVTSCR